MRYPRQKRVQDVPRVRPRGLPVKEAEPAARARTGSPERQAVPNGDPDTDSGSAERIRVLVVAGVRLYREGMAHNLGNREGLSVVGTAASPVEALQLVGATRPAVVVLDMAAGQSLDLVRAIKEGASGVKVIAFAVEEDEPEIIECAEAGVDGYVSCEGSMDDLTATIRSVSRGELLCSPRVAATLLRHVGALANGARPPHAADGLTAREHEVLRLIHEGLSNKDIALRLHIEVATVKNHVHNLLEKLQVGTRAEAASRLGPRPTPRRGRLGGPFLSGPIG